MIVFRTVIKAEHEMPNPTTISATLTTLDCGHISRGAPHFSLAKVGDKRRCFYCENPNHVLTKKYEEENK
jgi:hypothetical protein